MKHLLLLFLPVTALANVSVPVGNCSGVLFKMEGMSDDQPANVLTNGHCIGTGSFLYRFPANGELLLHHQDPYYVMIGKTKDSEREAFDYDTILFASMTGVDLAVIELKKTYRELQDSGYAIYTAARELPSIGTNLVFESYFKDVSSQCVVQSLVPTLREGPWTWHNFLRMEASESCRYLHGQSGTGGIEPSSQKLYALAQTMYEGGEPCEFNNPCEVSSKGSISVSKPSQGYAVPVMSLYGCFDANSKQFDFTLDTCSLNFQKNK